MSDKYKSEMKKTACLLFLFVCLVIKAKSQNLVPNYSFEVDTACPNNYSQIYYAIPWFVPHVNWSSSDLYDTCTDAINAGLGIPGNYDGYQLARTGYHYAGIIVYSDTINYREYLEVPLLDTLIANRNYCIEFYVSLAESFGKAISNIGAYFSNDSLLDSNLYHAIDYVTPQVENSISNMLSDTSNWMLVSGMFIANGGERFMTIGNFHNPANTNTQTVGITNNAYYFIDDVSVVDCTGIGIKEEDKDEVISIYPNPCASQLGITNYELGIKEIKIYNVIGELVYGSAGSPTQELTIDVGSLPKGLYFIEVQTDTQSINKKFIKQ